MIRLYDVKTAAIYLGLSVTTVYKHIKSGKIESTTSQGEIRVAEYELLRIMKNRREQC